MHKYKFIWIVLLLSVQFSNNLYAQEKFEKESRIRQKDVPPKAQRFIDSLDLKNKIKWYREEGMNRKSIEAKFKHNKAKHSVEFDTIGNIEDIEVEIIWEDLNLQLKDSISLHLKKRCSKHKIVKTQIQYLGSESDLFLTLKANETNQFVTINYELIVKCKQSKKVELFECLFNDAGTPLSVSKITFKNSSHLEY